MNKFEKEKKQQMLELERALNKLNTPVLDERVKLRIKDDFNVKLFGKKSLHGDRIDSLSRIVGALAVVASKTNLDSYSKERVKQRILAKIENVRPVNKKIWQVFSFKQKRLVSAVLVFVLAFTAIISPAFDDNVVLASGFTNLKSYSGEVYLARDGQILDVYQGIELKENDRVITGENAVAVIEYLDDSVSRLSSESEVYISKLESDPVNSVRTFVEIEVLEGKVWSKAVNLVEDKSSFVVEAGNYKAQATKAAFNVEFDEDQEVVISVFNNAVNLTSEDNVEINRIVSGEEVEVDSRRNRVIVNEISKEKREEEWVIVNLSSDVDHVRNVEERIVSENSFAFNVDPNDEISSRSKISDEALVFFSVNKVKKQKRKLNIASKKLLTISVKNKKNDFSEKELEEVNKIVDEFVAVVSNFYDLIEDTKEKNVKLASELEEYLSDVLFIHKKRLATVSSNSPVYKVKLAVDKVQLLAVKDKKEFVETRYKQTLDKFAEVDLIASTEDKNTALNVVEEYKKDLDNTIALVEKVSVNDNQTDDSKIEKSVNKVESFADLEKVIQETEDQIEASPTVDKFQDVNVTPVAKPLLSEVSKERLEQEYNYFESVDFEPAKVESVIDSTSESSTSEVVVSEEVVGSMTTAEEAQVEVVEKEQVVDTSDVETNLSLSTEPVEVAEPVKVPVLKVELNSTDISTSLEKEVELQTLSKKVEEIEKDILTDQ